MVLIFSTHKVLILPLPFNWWCSGQPWGLIASCPYPLSVSILNGERIPWTRFTLIWQCLTSEWHTLDCYTKGII